MSSARDDFLIVAQSNRYIPVHLLYAKYGSDRRILNRLHKMYSGTDDPPISKNTLSSSSLIPSSDKPSAATTLMEAVSNNFELVSIEDNVTRAKTGELDADVVNCYVKRFNWETNVEEYKRFRVYCKKD